MGKIVIELHGDFPEHPEAKAEVLKGLVGQLEEVHYGSACRPFSETDVRMVARTRVGKKELSLARYLTAETSLAGFRKMKKGLPGGVWESSDE